jgi:chromate reductase
MAVSVLTINGSLRNGSVNGAVLETVRSIAPANVAVTAFDSLADLPPFNPDNDRDPLPPHVCGLRQALAASDAVLFCTPEYAGGLPGAFKNLLDWTVGSTALRGKPAAWINAASPMAPAGGEDACASLRKVLGYVEAHVVETACVRVAVTRNVVEHGIVQDRDCRRKIAEALSALCDLVRHPAGLAG